MPPKNKKLCFLLADDHSLIRQGIEFLLEDMDFEMETLHSSTLQQTLEIVKTTAIDVAILDAHFPDGNSISIISDLKLLQPSMKILIYSGLDEESQVLKFINAGANGFLSKMSEEEEIISAITEVIHKGKFISAAAQTVLLHFIQNPHLINPLQQLSERELQIAALYAEGLGNLEIANHLNIKQNTVSTVKKRIFDKLNIDNIAELIAVINANQV